MQQSKPDGASYMTAWRVLWLQILTATMLVAIRILSHMHGWRHTRWYMVGGTLAHEQKTSLRHDTALPASSLWSVLRWPVDR